MKSWLFCIIQFCPWYYCLRVGVLFSLILAGYIIWYTNLSGPIVHVARASIQEIFNQTYQGLKKRGFNIDALLNGTFLDSIQVNARKAKEQLIQNWENAGDIQMEDLPGGEKSHEASENFVRSG